MQNTRPILAWETLLDLGDADERRIPLHVRLERALRAAVADGRLPAGAALPPSRLLAERLGFSRWVVTEAYGQLVAEGVLDARVGSATRVGTGVIASEPSTPSRTTPAAPPSGPPTDRPPRIDLRPGIPDLRAVPRSRWAAALRAALTALPDQSLAAAPMFGHPAAREAVADHLARSRHAVVDPDRVRITHGASDGMSAIAEELHRRGHRAILVEDPSWPRLREAAAAAGLRPVPVPVDADGVDVEALEHAAAVHGARAALVTPAHQFPLGAALSPARRERIAAWARTHDAIIIEDDYDAEFRYDRRPIAALQRLAPERVALLGSLSKTVSPALGVGWALLPPGFDPKPSPATPSLIDQAALAHFISSGDLERHLRASRLRLRRRRERLLVALHAVLPDLSPTGIAAGMHLVLPLPSGVRAEKVQGRGAPDVALTAIHRYAADRKQAESLVLGYGNLDDALIEEAAGRLALLVRTGRSSIEQI